MLEKTTRKSSFYEFSMKIATSHQKDHHLKAETLDNSFVCWVSWFEISQDDVRTNKSQKLFFYPEWHKYIITLKKISNTIFGDKSTSKLKV